MDVAALSARIGFTVLLMIYGSRKTLAAYSSGSVVNSSG